MLVAKYIDADRREHFAEVIRQGAVSFDPRTDWLLLAMPLEAPAIYRNPFWVRPEEISVVWLRQFSSPRAPECQTVF